jgi:hypothetical protein
MPGDDQEYRRPSRSTPVVALAVEAYAPPGVDQADDIQIRCDHVASPVVAGAPVPSSPLA